MHEHPCVTVVWAAVPHEHATRSVLRHGWLLGADSTATEQQVPATAACAPVAAGTAPPIAFLQFAVLVGVCAVPTAVHSRPHHDVQRLHLAVARAVTHSQRLQGALPRQGHSGGSRYAWAIVMHACTFINLCLTCAVFELLLHYVYLSSIFRKDSWYSLPPFWMAGGFVWYLFATYMKVS